MISKMMEFCGKPLF